MRYNFTKTQKREMAARSRGICEAGRWGTEPFYGMATGETCSKPATEFDHVTPTGLSQRPVTAQDGLHTCSVHHKVKTHGRDRPMIKKAKDIREKNMGITRQKKKWPKRGFGGWKSNVKQIVEGWE